ncbi:hypothetical protein D9K80_18215 [Acinetobacter cumulans]|uniref:Type VI secretion system (T6SS), amidase effector protein 4 n=1 Tax=Acinetobacter cumulans TaxID=2136182 RepID=A0A498CU59_9GAMM|nr:type VI secretion system amidase effector protein Tae4 [Acinetobacter cumulans]RLL27579.1 hypothetical protein D9K80_18215 [Acinetobacter cumulans]
MVIEAEVDGVISEPLKVNRPRWTDMAINYPNNTIHKETLYPQISRALGREINNDAYANTCALRMSAGLIRSGVQLPKAPSKGGTIVGDDGKNYWIRVKDLKAYLYTLFKKPDLSVDLPKLSSINPYVPEELDHRLDYVKNNIIEKIKNKKGIIVFEVTGWGDSTGHFTLWEGGENGRGLLYSSDDQNNPDSATYYFWMVATGNNNGITQKVDFWELK